MPLPPRAVLLLLLVSTPSSADAFGSLLFNRILNGKEECKDDSPNCKDWAADGECDSNPSFMLTSCRRSCGKCPGLLPVKRRKGCEDAPEFNCTERAKLGECDSNKGEMLYNCPRSCMVCGWQPLMREAFACDDTHANCGEWARHGECNANPNFMGENCAASCNLCERKRRSCDRPPNTPPVVRAGDINDTMVRIMRDFPQYNPKALSRPGMGKKGAESPWVITLENFISDEEAEAFKTTCKDHFDRSLAGDQLSPVRTSSQCWCSNNACERHPLTNAVAERISNLTRAPIRYMEPFQILRYHPGQFYKQHHDQNSGLFTPQGVRVYTFFMYLSTPEKGGGTRFNNLDLLSALCCRATGTLDLPPLWNLLLTSAPPFPSLRSRRPRRQGQRRLVALCAQRQPRARRAIHTP